MWVFEGKTVTVTKIVSVMYHDMAAEQPGKRILRYGSQDPCYELLYHLSGEEMLYYAGEELRVTADTMVFLPKNIPDADYRVEMSEPMTFVHIFFETQEPLPRRACAVQCADAAMRKRFERLFHVWRSRKEGYYAQTMSIFYEIIHGCMTLHNRYLPGSQWEQLERSVAYLHQNCMAPEFDYQAMAACSGLSYSYFKTLFLKRVGIPPVRYVTQLRVDYAQELLETCRYSVAQIAELCGFENVYYFSNVFKKYVGVSPRQYQRAGLEDLRQRLQQQEREFEAMEETAEKET